MTTVPSTIGASVVGIGGLGKMRRRAATCTFATTLHPPSQGSRQGLQWRAYAQEPLQERIGVIPASLVIGTVWGAWHLTLWFMAGDLHGSYSFVAFLLMTTSISVVYAWLYNSSGKKLLPVVFFRAVSNTAAPYLPFLHGIAGQPERAYWIYAAVNVVVGAAFVFFIAKRSTGAEGQPSAFRPRASARSLA